MTILTFVTLTALLYQEIVMVTGMYTGKSLSEALIFASTNPQYDNRLFIELQAQYMKIPISESAVEQFLYTTCCLHGL